MVEICLPDCMQSQPYSNSLVLRVLLVTAFVIVLMIEDEELNVEIPKTTPSSTTQETLAAVNIDDSDEDQLESELAKGKRRRSPSSDVATVGSALSAKRRSRSSVYENAAQIAAEGMISLGVKVIEAQQILALSLESQFTQCIRALTEMKTEGNITTQEYFQICRKFRTDKETYSEMFMGMTTELRLEWLTLEGLLGL